MIVLVVVVVEINWDDMRMIINGICLTNDIVFESYSNDKIVKLFGYLHQDVKWNSWKIFAIVAEYK